VRRLYPKCLFPPPSPSASAFLKCKSNPIQSSFKTLPWPSADGAAHGTLYQEDLVSAEVLSELGGRSQLERGGASKVRGAGPWMRIQCWPEPRRKA
jgi:hypothetical protein